MYALVCVLFSLATTLAVTPTQAEDKSKEFIPISPSVLSGTLISLMMLVFLYVGFCALKNISSPQHFTPMPLIIGKEK